MRRPGWWLVGLALLAWWGWRQVAPPRAADAARAVVVAPTTVPAATGGTGAWPAFLPSEARDTLARIEAGGPFAHRQDGGVFGNRERRLPLRPRGYYREYTVQTPGSGDRGARRIVAGGQPPVEYFYTADHYRSFRRFEPPSGDLR